jgi:putative tryptophan/tyrosine transport system substrate-binding protein
LGDAERTRKYAAELLALSPDVILAIGTETTAALQHVTRTVPIIFVLVPDPVGAGIVDSLSRPGGNATGFTPSEYAIGGKMLELLKEIAPRVKRAGIIRDAASPSGPAQFAAIQAVAPSVGVEVSPIGIRDAGDKGHKVLGREGRLIAKAKYSVTSVELSRCRGIGDRCKVGRSAGMITARRGAVRT